VKGTLQPLKHPRLTTRGCGSSACRS
jgi:hypothetical protein